MADSSAVAVDSGGEAVAGWRRADADYWPAEVLSDRGRPCGQSRGDRSALPVVGGFG